MCRQSICIIYDVNLGPDLVAPQEINIFRTKRVGILYLCLRDLKTLRLQVDARWCSCENGIRTAAERDSIVLRWLEQRQGNKIKWLTTDVYKKNTKILKI